MDSQKKSSCVFVFRSEDHVVVLSEEEKMTSKVRVQCHHHQNVELVPGFHVITCCGVYIAQDRRSKITILYQQECPLLRSVRWLVVLHCSD